MNPYRHDYGWHGPRGSYYGRGNVKFAILGLLKERPRHGYDIIREMEERSGGVYSPSPGVIYPTLQALEDQDFVKSAEQDGKKVYSITEAGEAYLQGHAERHGHGRHGEGHRPPWAACAGPTEPGQEGAAGDETQAKRPPQGEGPHGPKGPNWVRTGPGEQGAPCEKGGPGAWGPGGAAAWGTWFASSGGPELMREMRWMFGDFATAVQRTLGDQEKMKEIRDVLREAKAKIDEIVMK
jgi:DNA-binding PadR family transcriptional regulator